MIAEGMEKEVSSCRKRGGAEDVNLGACAEEVGVKMVDSLDEHGEEAFHPFNPGYMLDKNAMERTGWVQSYNYYPIRTGLNCCSDHSVSFHYISPQDMYTLDYLIYHAYPYGIARDLEQYKELARLKQGKPLFQKPPISAAKPLVFGLFILIMISTSMVLNFTDNRTLADELAKKVRVFGMIVTMPQAKLTKAIHVKETWARRLNGFTFISSEDDKNLPSIRTSLLH
ncbi:unnamed protein product [Rodentolepis nana]|uniref:Aldo_ket_red domain-containing protein n=1 Tax=Rodentolepis nana TaxID=102285 RepID=A0A0R3T6T8_RODNA|nr:unnamed protein product [Rodentolepis nana]